MLHHGGKVKLSPQEGRVMVLLCQGIANPEIADYLGITYATLKKYISELLNGLRLSGRPALMIWGLQHPQAISTLDWTEPPLHLPGCTCDSPYCTTMRSLLPLNPQDKSA